MGEIAREMIELGIGTEGIGEEEVTEMTEGCLGAMLDVMITTDHHEGTEIFLKVAWIEGQEVAVEVLHEVIETNSLCRWVVETGRRARALRQRRRNPLQI